MTSSIPPKYGTYDNSSLPIFNPSFFSYGSSTYATLADLLNYANLHNINTFTNINNFTDLNIFQTINGISANFLEYIQYIPNIINELTNITYDASSNTTFIDDNVAMQTIGADNGAIGQLACESGVVSNVTSSSVWASNIYVKDLVYIGGNVNKVGCYINSNGLTYPVKKSSDISLNSGYMHVEDGFMVNLCDSNGICRFVCDNTKGSNYVYNVSFNNVNCIRVKIFYNYILV